MIARWRRWWLMGVALFPAILGASVPLPGGVWPDGAVEVALEFKNAPFNSSQADGAGREAMGAWNVYLQRVQLSPIAPTGQPWYDNGRNEMFFATKAYGEELGDGVLAVTGQSFDRGQRVESDIVLNAAIPWAVYHGPLKTDSLDLRRVMVHELGHVLGLDHPDEAGQNVSAIMNAYIGDIETPTSDDQSGLHALYDRGSSAAPVILHGPVASAAGAPAGGQVKFEVLAGGRGPYSYTWRRDGVTVPGATASVLRIDPVKLLDAGNYTVVVGNGINSITSQPVKFTVSPVDPPKLLSNVSANWDVSISMGNDYTFRPPDIQIGSFTTSEWKHNGVTVATVPQLEFTLRDAQFSDSGDYTVTASNPGGSVTGRTYHVTVVPVAPNRFLLEPAPMDYPIGVFVSLSIPSSTVPGPYTTYQWKKDGLDVPGAVGHSFDIPSFQASDAGAYTLTITDSFGQSTSAPLRVTVRGTAVAIPVITRQPAAQGAFLGTRASFSAIVEGAPFSYRWLKDGVPLGPLQNVPSVVSQTPLSYSVPPLLKAEDAGTYSLEISNALGSTTSRGAKLTVLPAIKPIILQQPSSVTAAVGGLLTLSCIAQVSYTSDLQQAFPGSDLQVQWFKDGTALPSSGSNRFSYGTAVTAATAGQYFARVTSPVGLATDTKTVTVTVTTGNLPVIPVQPPDLMYNRQDSESLRLALVGLGVQMRSYAPGAESSSLQLVSASGPAFGGLTPGTYVITATKAGVTETSQPFMLGFVPEVAPLITSHPAGQKPNVGQLVELSVSAFSFSTPTYLWSKDGVAITGATNSSYIIPSFAAGHAGSYQVTVSGAVGSATSEPALLELTSSLAPVIVTQPLSQIVVEGHRPSLAVVASGATLAYQWYKNGAPIAGATDAEIFLLPTVADSGAYTVRVSNTATSVTSKTATLQVLAAQRPPEIVSPPQSQIVALNGDAELAVSADGAPLPDHYQWRKNGLDLPGATSAKLRFSPVQAGDAGTYTVVAYNSLGSATSAPGVLTVDISGRLVNLATRANVGTGANVLIAGFVISGTKARSVLVRGVGDQLSEFGVTGVLRNPRLQLFDAKGKQVASSDDWFQGEGAEAGWATRIAALRAAEKETGAFPLREDTEDGALVATLAPGSYTAQVSGVVDTTGIGLVEVYELGRPSMDGLVNLSCRSFVGTGAAILIPGLVIRGGAPRRLLIRAVGPGLAAFGVSGALADPQLAIFRGGEQVAQNDNWSGDSVSQASAAVGAFPLAAGSKDAALLIDLPDGSYTVQVSGANGAQGIALVEVYEIRP